MNLGRRNIRTEDLARAFSAARRDRLPLQGEIRAMYQRQQDGPWHLCIARCFLGAAPAREYEETYPGSIFICKALPPLRVQSFIAQLAGDGFMLSNDLPPVRITVNNPSWTEQVVPSDATESSVPRRLFSARIEMNAHFFEMQLAAFGMRYHASSAAYAKNFLGLTYFHGTSDSRTGELLIEIDDDRGIIRMNQDSLSIAGRMRKLCLVGQINGEEPINLVKGKRAAINVEEIRSVELWLLNKDNDVLDFRSSTGWPHKYEPAGEVQYRDEIRNLIAKGESETCEFKPYIDLQGSRKGLEIQRSVCALSNARGGRLLLGVSDEGEVGGLARDMAKKYGHNIEEACASYIRDIRAFLRETLKNNQCLTIDRINVLGSTVIVITVEKSSETNYLVNKNQAYVRRGGTNMKLTPPEIAAQASAPHWLAG